MKKKTIGLLLAALLVLTSLWLPAPLGGAREAAASDGPMRETRGIIRVTKNAKLYNMPGTASTYSNSEVLYDISAGKTLNVFRIYQNTAGNYWYWVEYDTGVSCQLGYVYSANTEWISVIPSDVQIADVRAPYKGMPQGKAYDIKGTVTSVKNPITAVSATVYRSGSEVISSKVTGLNTNSFDIYSSDVNNKLKFGTLSVGNYTFTIHATVQYYYCKDGKNLKTGQSTVEVYTTEFSMVDPNEGKTPLVTFDANGGSVNSSGWTVIYGDTYGSLPTPTRNGYVFDGWYTSADGGSLVTASTKVTNAADHTLYAHWTAAPTVTVTFDANGGDVIESSKTVTIGSTYGFLYNPDGTKMGGLGAYNFVGWYTSRTGGTLVTQTTIVTATSDHTLYAHWTPGEYTIKFDANGGTCSETSKNVTYGTLYGALPIPVRSGYSFAGWYFISGNPQYLITENTVVNTKPVWYKTVYAEWTPKTYTVTLNPNGGSCGTASKQVTYGKAYGTMPVPTRRGYTFAGWWTAKTGGKKVTASTICYASGNYTLYARWTEGYTMTFNPTGGTVSPTTKVVKYGQQYGSLPVPTRAGYTFAGWWTTKAEGGKQVKADTVCYASAGYTLYARWTAKKFVITLNPNGGEFATKTKTVTYGQAYGTMPVPSPRTGYTFAGWYTAKTGGKKVTATTVCYATANYTLYARWTPKTYTVTLNPNGGTCTAGSKTVTYGQQYGTLPVPTRDGYVFAGWYTTQTTGGKQVFSSTTCYATGNYTLYARWWKN